MLALEAPTLPRWTRRVYDDRRYQDTGRHLVVAEDATTVTTACGRRLERVTAARVPNRLVDAANPRSDIPTCGLCAAKEE